MSDDIDNPGLKFLGVDTVPSVSVSVGAPSIYDNAKPISTTKAPVDTANPVSYTHLTLPTNREV